MPAGTRRQRFLDWVRNGDPDQVPVNLGLNNFEVASARLGKDQREVTWAQAVAVAEETGTHLTACVGMPLPADAIPFLDDIEVHEKRSLLPDGTPRLTKTIATPEGTLTEVREMPADRGEYHREFFVKGEGDLPAFAYLIRKATEAVVANPQVARAVGRGIQAVKDQVAGAFPTMLWPFCPAVELTCSLYMDQATAVYLLYDHTELFEELMDRHWAMTQVWLELGERHDVDAYGYAINGFEWLSPDLYERYMIPQARRICEFAAAHGKLSWVHTCGRMKRIAEMDAYRRMGVSVVESLSLPPTGDIDDLARTRGRIGPDITTRGGINCELLYDDDVDAVRRRTRHILESTKGYRHVVGDTNPSYPSYPWANVAAVIDTVRQTGRMLV